MKRNVQAAGYASVLLGLAMGVLWMAGGRDRSSEGALQAAEKPHPQKPPALPPLTVDRQAPLLLDEPKKASALPALTIDRHAPLLLDEPKKKPETEDDAKPVADNESCFVCHGNYREEPMALEHARVNVGCVKCHGQSLLHRDDEDNITPPDIIFPAAAIDSACQKCHEEHNASPKKIIARWQERCPGKTNPTELICTDCHGRHRLALRTVRWDKNTRQLIVAAKDEKQKQEKKDQPKKSE